MQTNFEWTFKKHGYTGISISIFEEYTQFFQRCNWYTFTPVNLELDWEKDMGCVSVDCVLLGIGFGFTLRYNETETVKDLKDRIAQFKEGDHKIFEDLPQ